MKKNEKWCPNCEQFVVPEKEEFWQGNSGGIGCSTILLIAILGFLIGGPIGTAVLVNMVAIFMAVVFGAVVVIRGVEYYFFKEAECPICGTTNLRENSGKRILKNDSER